MYICGLWPKGIIKDITMENNDTCKLLYNTERVMLHIPEYGRNVQKMVDYLKTIEDRQKRNEQARAIIKVMEILNPAVHLQDNYEQKLWDHLFIIADFDLDVDSPYPMPERESLNQRPEPVPIQKKPIRASHYGRNIENMIDLVAQQEDEEQKIGMIRVLAGYMKQQYLIWNKDTVSDETIFQDIEKLSDYRIKVPEGLQIGKVQHDNSNRQPNAQGWQKNHKQKNNQKNRKQHK